jgi:hypothetical protein
MAWTVPYTLVGGTAITAGWANTNVRDNELYLYTQAHHQGQFVYGNTIAAPTVTAHMHNWNPPGLATANVVRIDSTGLFDLTGMEAQPHGTFFWMVNGSGGTLRIKNNDTRSTINNRITTSTSGDYDLHYLGLLQWLYLYGQWRVKV